jgi:hypothetical protein
MQKRMNGWRRLWVVVAALGLLYAGWFALTEAAETYALKGGVLLAFDRPECKAIAEMPAGHKLDPGPAYDDPCWELYLYRSVYNDASNTSAGYAEHMSVLQRSRALDDFLFALAVWLVSVSLLYAGGAVVAWVVRGFRPSAE